MHKQIDVSVIMPAYNTDKYIAQAIESVCKQTKPNVELIIVNDGSTDNTKQIIQEKLQQYSNIVYIEEENSGLSFARKVGLDNARGKYVYFVDSDDYIYDNSLDLMFKEAEENNLDCLMVNAVFKNELDNEYGNRMDKKNVVSKMDNSKLQSGEELLKNMIINREWRYAVWLYFIRKDMLDNVTFFKDFIHEDSAFNYELLSNANNVKFINENVYVYRLRKNSLMSTKTSLKNILGYINSFCIICQTNNQKEFKYENLLFEMRILDQIIETYGRLEEKDKNDAKKEFNKIKPLIIDRNNYYIDKYRDFFETNQNILSEDNNIIEYLEVDIVDHCNLNCDNCSHFSPFAEEAYLDVYSFENDMKQLSKLIDGKLKRLVLMGGEPLLHKNINDFIHISRNYFPETQIQILTNGILINKMSEDFWKACKDNNIQINVTAYPINLDYINVYNTILKHDLKMFIYDNGITDQKEFYSYVFDPNKAQDMYYNYKNCYMSKTCANFKNGKIYLCPITNNIDRYNKHYKTNYEVLDEDFIDIYKVKSSQEIYDFLSEPTPFCKYCNLKENEKVKWKRYKK